MEQHVLTDKNQFPTDEVIHGHLGKSKNLWLSLFAFLHDNHPDFNQQWRFYNDGKRWLMKVSQKTRTIFWLSVVEGTFRTTFYFTAKAGQAIAQSALTDDLKRQFTAGKRINKITGVTIVYKNRQDVEHAKELIAIKVSIK